MTPRPISVPRIIPRRRVLAAGALAGAGSIFGVPRVRGIEPTGDARVLASLHEPELGHNIATLSVATLGGNRIVDFLGHYHATGGLRRAGHAISEAIVEDNALCQYFQRGVIECRTDGDEVVLTWRDMWTVLGGGAGAASIAALPSEVARTNPNPGRAIGPFGHIVSNQAIDGTSTGFLDLYDAINGEASLGEPLTAARLDTGEADSLITEEFSTGLIRQYFETSVLEVSPAGGETRLTLAGDPMRDTTYPNGGWSLIGSFHRKAPVIQGRRLRLERTESLAGLQADPAPVPPPGFEISEFAATNELGFPAVLEFAADGRLFIGFSNDLVATMRDTTGDGRANEIRTFASGDGVTDPRGLAFAGDRLFVSVEDKIIRLRDTTGSGAADESADVVTGLGLDTSVPFHRNNGIAIGPDGLLYMTLGSTTNAGEINERPLSAYH